MMHSMRDVYPPGWMDEDEDALTASEGVLYPFFVEKVSYTLIKRFILALKGNHLCLLCC